MKKVKVLFCLTIVFILTSCSPITRAKGEVFDSNGLPLTSVKLSIVGKSLNLNSKLEYLTKEDGRYNFGEFDVSTEIPIEIKLIAEKEGFKTFTKELKYGEDNVDKIILEKLP